MQRRKFFASVAGATSFSILSSCSSRITSQHASTSAHPPFSYKGISRSEPTSEELMGYYKRFSNWNRWGHEDRMGTLNFIEKDTVMNASKLVREGRSISIGRPIQSGTLDMEIYRTEGGDRGSTHDTLTVHAHGYTETHLDALCHISSETGKLYNGHPETDVTMKGAAMHGIEHWKDGIVTRAVFYDIPKLRDIPHVPVDVAVQGWELEDFARQHKIVPQKGDAVIINCGRNSFFRRYPENPNTLGDKPGLNPSVLEYLHAYDAALMGSDFDEAPNTGKKYPTNYSIHHVANPFMGLPTFWNLDLERLSDWCRDKNTWEFLLVIAPLIVKGGTGSVVNPIAIV